MTNNATPTDFGCTPLILVALIRFFPLVPRDFASHCAQKPGVLVNQWNQRGSNASRIGANVGNSVEA